MNIFQNQYSILNAFFRSIPLSLPIIIFILYYLTKEIELFNLFIGILVVNFICVYLFKKFFVILLDLYAKGNNEIYIQNLPFIGLISRPSGAKNCGCFYINETHYSNTSGMPSGHSMLMSFTCVYLYHYINKKYKLSGNYKIGSFIIFLLITIYMMYTRVLMGCHTIEQTILGSIIGGILGHYYYIYFSKQNKIKI